MHEKKPLHHRELPPGHHQANSRKGYMTSSNPVTALPGEMWSIPPQSMSTSVPVPNATTSFNTNHHQRLLNLNPPPPMFDVSSLQAGPPPSHSTSGGGEAGGARAGHQRNGSGGHRTTTTAVAPTPSPLALLDENSEASEITLDAAKRKNLPAWIR